MVDLNGKNILVTGGCGFIGSNFLQMILDLYENMHVVNIDKMGHGSREFIPNVGNNKYTKRSLDIKLLKSVPWHFRIPELKYDYIFHFAAESHVDRSINSPSEFVSNNVIGMMALLEYLRTTQPQARLVNISTDEVYGHLNLNDPPFTEESPIEPRSPYSASKASADILAASYHRTYGLDIITTRCCNNYGPNQDAEKFIPTILNALNNNQKIPVYGNGKNVREWIYVGDHNKSILEIVEHGKSGMVFNIGTGIEKNNLEIIKSIIDIVHGRGSLLEDYIEFVDDRKGHDFRYALTSINYNRTFDLLSFNDGINKTVESFRQ